MAGNRERCAWPGPESMPAARAMAITRTYCMYHGERFNSITHLVGAALAVAGAAVLVVKSSLQGDAWRIVGFSVFGAMLVVLYTASTLYHSLKPPVKDVLRRFDHSAIFLLIAGTYTPFALVSLRGPLGWTMLGAIWAAAIFGIWRAWRRCDDRPHSALPFALMGWLGLAAVVPLTEAIGLTGMLWLAAGGLLYTAGIVFYVNDDRWRHAHGIWHLFVLGGSASHFTTVLWFV
jgi:hemolysin III